MNAAHGVNSYREEYILSATASIGSRLDVPGVIKNCYNIVYYCT